MFADLVKTFAITCPECNTSIKFDIHSGNNEIQELFNAVNELECPKCKNSMANDAQNIVRAIHDYNGAVSKLLETANITQSKLG